MEAIIPVIVVAVFLFGVIRAVRTMGKQQSWNRAYKQVSLRYNGKNPDGKVGVKSGFLFSGPSLIFKYRGRLCAVQSRRSRVLDGRLVTRLRITRVDDLPSFECSTSQLRSRRNQSEPERRITFSNPDFQARYNAASRKRDEAQTLLNQDAVTWQLEQLNRLGEQQGIYIRCRRGVLEIIKPGEIWKQVILDDFVRLGLQFFDQLLLGKAAGISFTDIGLATIVDDVKCPICSEEITQDMVVCIRCKTPHCRDCWQYNGQCATFACSETRFLEVSSAQ